MVETTRLILVPLSHEQLLLYKNDPIALAHNLNVKYIAREHDPATVADVAEALEFWISHTLLYRDRFEWFTTWQIILKEPRLDVGGIGFAGFPNDDGKTEVGYGIDMRYHGNGYASEALEGILKWAYGYAELRSVTAQSPLQHIASHRVLIKNGFAETHRDEQLTHWHLNRGN